MSGYCYMLTFLGYLDTITVSTYELTAMQIHPDDWETWKELVQSIKDGQRPNLVSRKRRRSLIAIAKLLEEMEENKLVEVKE